MANRTENSFPWNLKLDNFCIFDVNFSENGDFRPNKQELVVPPLAVSATVTEDTLDGDGKKIMVR